MEGVPIPEGPEMRYSADQLTPRLVGSTLVGLKPMSGGRYVDKDPEGLTAFYAAHRTRAIKISEVSVKGKFMWWRFDHQGAPWWLWTTYGMSGRWSWAIQSGHCAFKIQFSRVDGTLDVVYFNDPRHFGTLRFTNSAEEHAQKLASLGPDMLSSPPDDVTFAECILHKPNRTIAEALMDQGTVSGIGNYLKAEILYRGGISPHRPVTQLTAQELVDMAHHAHAVMQESYTGKGASFRSYRNPDETPGGAQFSLRVYNMKTALCGHKVTKEKTADGRTSHWCQICQK